MSQKRICDICQQPISGDGIQMTLSTDITMGPGPDFKQEPTKLDLCNICWTSPIILSEKRRTRTRKPKPKVGRPKGKKTNHKPIEIDEGVADALGVADGNS